MWVNLHYVPNIIQCSAAEFLNVADFANFAVKKDFYSLVFLMQCSALFLMKYSAVFLMKYSAVRIRKFDLYSAVQCSISNAVQCRGYEGG